MSLSHFFNPSSIAIVGVSEDEKKVGHIVAENIINQGYKGNLYFINPHADNILGKKIYKSLREIHEAIDLVVLCIPADGALSYLEEMNTLKIQNAVIYAAGFKETDEAGAKKEELLKEKAVEYGITVLGPNCLGFINTEKKINATFLNHVCPAGNIGFISQSGAIGSAMVDYFVAHQNLGFSYFISLGNKTVVDESDCLEFLLEDEKTEVIGMYLEGVKDGAKFRSILQKVSNIKPVIILKSGTTAEGSKAALSHTGGLVGQDEVYDAVFRQAGAIRSTGYAELLTILKIFSYKKIPTSSSTLVLSNAGGIGVLLTDELIKNEMPLVTISDKTKKQIEQSIKEQELKKISVHNPIDLLGDASAFDYEQAIIATMREKEIGSTIVLLTPQANTQIPETAQVIVKAQSYFATPIFPIFIGEKSIGDSQKLFEKNKIVNFPSYDTVPKILKNIITYKKNRFRGSPSSFHPENLSIMAKEPEIKSLLDTAKEKKYLNLHDSIKILDYSTIPTVPLTAIESEKDIEEVSRKNMFPLVAKIASDTITHKTEVKGVISGIKTKEELQKAHHELGKISKTSLCYVQKMVSGSEIFVGAKRDAQFGPVIVLGLGGIYTELLKEVSYLIYPFTYEEFLLMIENTKIAKLLKGFRNLPTIDFKDIYSLTLKIGFLLERFTEIQEIDINPLFATEKGVVAVDCRIIL